MKFILAIVMCAVALHYVSSMPVAEPNSQEPLPVVPLEKSSTQHVLRRETAEPAPDHKENESPEEHEAHKQLTAKLAEEPQGEPKLTEEPKPAVVESKEEKPAKLELEHNNEEDKPSKKKDDESLNIPEPQPQETVRSAPVESAVPETPSTTSSEIIAEPKNVEAVPEEKSSESIKELVAEEKPDEVKHGETPKSIEPVNDAEPIAKSAPVEVPAEPETQPAKLEQPLPIQDKKEETIRNVEASPVQGKAGVKPEEKTDRVTRGTEPGETTKVSEISEPAAAVSASSTESEKHNEKENSESEDKQTDTLEAPKKEEKKIEVKTAEPTIELSHTAPVAEEPKIEGEKEIVLPIQGKPDEPIIQAKKASNEEKIESTEGKSESGPSEVTKVKSEVIESIAIEKTLEGSFKETVPEPQQPANGAVKVAEAGNPSSEEKSSEESSHAAESSEEKKDESKAEELPKPQELLEKKE